MSTHQLTTKRLIAVLRKVPEKKFRIEELAPKLIDKDGKVDIGKCIDQQGELNLAIAELQTYIKGVRIAGFSLTSISSKAIETDEEQIEAEADAIENGNFYGEDADDD